MGFKDTSKYQDKQNKPSFMNTEKYKFMDTSKYKDSGKPAKVIQKYITPTSPKTLAFPEDKLGWNPLLPKKESAPLKGKNIAEQTFDFFKDAAVGMYDTGKSLLSEGAQSRKDNKALVENYSKYKQGKISKAEYEKIAAQARNKNKAATGTFVQSLADSATLGISTKAQDALTGGKATKTLDDGRKNYPGLSGAGNIAGYAVPFAGAGNIVKPLTKKIGNTIVRDLAKTAAEGFLVGGADSTARQMEQNNSLDPRKVDFKKALNEGKDYAGLGLGFGAIGLGLKGVAKGIDKLVPEKALQLQRSKTYTPNRQLGKSNSTNIGNAIDYATREVEMQKNNVRITRDRLSESYANKSDQARYNEEVQILNEKEQALNKLKSKIPKSVSKSVTMQSRATRLPLPLAEIQVIPKEKSQKFNKFYDRVVDKYNPLKLISQDTHVKAINSANTGNVVSNIVNKELVNIKGEKVGESMKDLLKNNVPKETETDFWRYMKEKLNTYRAQEVVDAQGNVLKKANPVYKDRTPEQSKSEVKAFERDHPDWVEKSTNITNWIDKFHRTWGVETGITERQMYEILRANNPDYIPTNREFSTLEEGFSRGGVGGKGFVNETGVIKKATGSDRGIKAIPENMLNMVNRTVKTAKYNDVGLQMLNDIRSNPITDVARIIPDGESINPNVNNIVTVLEGGKPVKIEINDTRVLKALQGMDSMEGDITRIARSATSMFTGLITHKNPLFAIPNAARDIQSGLINTSINNPIKYIGELSKSVKDIVTNSEAWRQYQGVGGGGSNFISPDTTKAVKSIVNEPGLLKRGIQKIENFNSLMESAPRLTEFKKVFKETGDVNKALYAASDVTTNFSRGGDITKSVNAFVPFTNAGVQGLDKLARSLDFRNPKRAMATLIKGGIGVTIPTAVFNYINKDNPNYQKLDNRTKDNNFLIPIGDKFIKIPKSREYGVLFGSLFERLSRLYNDDPNAFKGFLNTVETNFAPASPLSDNILAPALRLKLGSNKDFADRDIVPRWMKDQNLSPKLQFDEKTTELAKFIGDKANVSPKQIDYIMRSYLGVLAQVGAPMMTQDVQGKSTSEKLLSPITTKFTADPVYSSQSMTDFYDNFDKAKQAASDRNTIEKIRKGYVTPEEKVLAKYNKAQKSITELNKLVKQAKTNEEAVKYRKQIIEIADIMNKIEDKR